jgi:hypothetical protein
MAKSVALEAFLSGNPTKSFRLLAARGVFPLPPSEILQLLLHLHKDPDVEVAEQAGRTLQDWPEGEVLELLDLPDCDPGVLEYFATARTSDAVLLAVAHNPSTPESMIALLASQVRAELLEAILDNRVRILQFPEILESAKRNPNVTSGVRRLIQEIDAEFFSGKKGHYQVETPTEKPVDAALEEELELLPEDLSLEGLPLDPEAREEALLQRIAKMSPRQKIKLALLGTREERGILIRDTNKQIAGTVLKSPKLSESEIETFSAMRNISDEILREIGNTREWVKRYAVAQNLVRNPRTPPILAQRLVSRLQSKDLMLLSRDRGVSEPIRRIAQRTLAQRTGNK